MQSPAYKIGDAVWLDVGAPECPGDFTVGVISKIRPVEPRDDDGNALPLEPAPKRLKVGLGSGPNAATNTAPIKFEYRVEFAHMYEACHCWFDEKEIQRYDTSSGHLSGLLDPSDWHSTYEPHGIDAEEHAQFSEDFYEHLMKHGAMITVKQPHCDAIFDCHKTVENRSTQWPIVCPGHSPMRHTWVLVVASKNDGTAAEWKSAVEDTIKNMREHDCWDDEPSYVDNGCSLKDREAAIKRMQRPRKEFERGCIIGMMAINNRWSHVDQTHSDPWAKPNPPSVDWRNRVFHWTISKAIRFKTPIPFKGCQSPYRYLNKLPDAEKLVRQIVYEQNELLGHRGPRNVREPHYKVACRKARRRWRAVAAFARSHAIALYWLERTQRSLCAPDGAGRAADAAAFESDF
jgi:hypothetical protein